MSKKPACAAIAAVCAVLALVPAGVFMSAAVAKDTLASCNKFADGWKATYNAKNADALAGMYDPSKGNYSNVFWTGTGHAVLAQGFKQELMAGNTMTSIKCDMSTQTGDFGVSKGTWSAAGKGPDGKDMTIGGHWQTTFEDQHGKILIVDHTSNMQLPPPK